MAFCTHPDVWVLGVKPRYIHEKEFKSHVLQFKNVFRDDLGNIKGIKKVHGVQRVYRGTRERPYKCDSHGVVKSAITHLRKDLRKAGFLAGGGQMATKDLTHLESEKMLLLAYC